jgi:hypothetical protein
VMSTTLPKGTLDSVASLLAAILCQGHTDRNHKLWNIVSSETEIYTPWIPQIQIGLLHILTYTSKSTASVG